MNETFNVRLVKVQAYSSKKHHVMEAFAVHILDGRVRSSSRCGGKWWLSDWAALSQAELNLYQAPETTALLSYSFSFLLLLSYAACCWWISCGCCFIKSVFRFFWHLLLSVSALEKSLLSFCPWVSFCQNGAAGSAQLNLKHRVQSRDGSCMGKVSNSLLPDTLCSCYTAAIVWLSWQRLGKKKTMNVLFFYVWG